MSETKYTAEDWASLSDQERDYFIALKAKYGVSQAACAAAGVGTTRPAHWRESKNGVFSRVEPGIIEEMKTDLHDKLGKGEQLEDLLAAAGVSLRAFKVNMHIRNDNSFDPFMVKPVKASPAEFEALEPGVLKTRFLAGMEAHPEVVAQGGSKGKGWIKHLCNICHFQYFSVQEALSNDAAFNKTVDDTRTHITLHTLQERHNLNGTLAGGNGNAVSKAALPEHFVSVESWEEQHAGPNGVVAGGNHHPVSETALPAPPVASVQPRPAESSASASEADAKAVPATEDTASIVAKLNIIHDAPPVNVTPGFLTPSEPWRGSYLHRYPGVLSSNASAVSNNAAQDNGAGTSVLSTQQAFLAYVGNALKGANGLPEILDESRSRVKHAELKLWLENSEFKKNFSDIINFRETSTAITAAAAGEHDVRAKPETNGRAVPANKHRYKLHGEDDKRAYLFARATVDELKIFDPEQDSWKKVIGSRTTLKHWREEVKGFLEAENEAKWVARVNARVTLAQWLRDAKGIVADAARKHKINRTTLITTMAKFNVVREEPVTWQDMAKDNKRINEYRAALRTNGNDERAAAEAARITPIMVEIWETAPELAKLLPPGLKALPRDAANGPKKAQAAAASSQGHSGGYADDVITGRLVPWTNGR